MTIYITPEALAERIMALERLISEKGDSARIAAAIEAAALEARIQQDIASRYAMKTDMDRLSEKIGNSPTRNELLGLVTLISAAVSFVITIVMKIIGK